MTNQATTASRSERCPRCDSPDPARHPAVQSGGEVQVCPHEWHDPQATTDGEGSSVGWHREIEGVGVPPSSPAPRGEGTEAVADPSYDDQRIAFFWQSVSDHPRGMISFIEASEIVRAIRRCAAHPSEAVVGADAVSQLRFMAANLRDLGPGTTDFYIMFHERVLVADNIDAILAALSSAQDGSRPQEAVVPTEGHDAAILADEPIGAGEIIGGGRFLYRTTLTGERHVVDAATGFVWFKLPYDYRFTDNATQRSTAEAIIAALAAPLDDRTAGYEAEGEVNQKGQDR